MTVVVLVADDEPDVEALFGQRVRREVRQGLCTLDFALSGEAALDNLDGCVWPADHPSGVRYQHARHEWLDLIPAVQTRRPDLPVFMISAYGDAERVEAALKRGAGRFLSKPVDFPQLKQEVSRAISDVRGSE